ncbi:MULTISPECIES: DUF5359 family protein [Pontibacillus]|uniref:DUF5359 family protein n=1 Tax=Pontibacillus chungwhensis TaxID=265426 RepID=A0ABY8UUH7_9BACI|nr:DUF5359 family protein [Pontibacillus chungwhensis]MCD5323012.1 YpfB family protein [Pontibacillus sp. HN14]WIF96406.1 DUF5359 family protein [Pontibacillus chungwhensis]
MKRFEQWLLTLVVFHAFLLIIVQALMLHTDFSLYVQPVYEYFGIGKSLETNIVETIDRIFSDVLSF